jgi:murein DD-endopeptidase MepM/ murein hydrolase activator NlpD
MFAQAGAKPKARPVKSWNVIWQPTRLVNGVPVILRVKSPIRLESLSGEWLGHEIAFAYNAKRGNWNALAGVGLETRPGTYPLVLKGSTKAGKEIAFTRQIRVQAGKYRTVALRVPKQYTQPDAEQLQRIHEDQTLKQQVFTQSSTQRAWSGMFLPPVKAAASDVFGTRRTFNGEVQSVHQGLDYAARAGTPVRAVNAGTVLLARPLFFEGNCLVLDHGQGLLTLYMHLSKIEVEEGKQVKRGQRLGRVGGTGRATGPHLHLGVRWQGEYLNPATLLKFKLP